MRLSHIQQVCAEPRTSALNMTLPADRAPVATDRYLSPLSDLISKPAARCRCYPSTGQTDGRTPDHYTDAAGSVVNKAVTRIYFRGVLGA